MNDKKDLMSTKEAAEYLCCKPATLNAWRCKGGVNLPYMKLGSKVLYDRADLDRVLKQTRVEMPKSS